MSHSLSQILAGAAGDSAPAEAIDKILEAVRVHLGMDIAFASKFVDGRREFTHINANGSVPARVGDSEPQEETYCHRILQGRLPELIVDANDYPEALELPITAALPVGSHLNVPLRLSDGSVYGSFCCLSHLPDRTLTARDLDTMRAFAALAAEQIEGDLNDEAERHERAGRIMEVIEQNRIAMVYQPIHRLSDGRPVGVEALARFPDQAERTPDKWFAEAADRARRRARNAGRAPGDSRPALHPGRIVRGGERLPLDRNVATVGGGGRRRSRGAARGGGHRAQQGHRS